MDPGRFVLSDTVWAKIEALLPGKKSDRGVTAKDNRLFLEAVLWRARAGLPWRDLPPEFGHWNSVFTRFRRWVRAMVFERIFKALSGEPVSGAKVRARRCSMRSQTERRPRNSAIFERPTAERYGRAQNPPGLLPLLRFQAIAGARISQEAAGRLARSVLKFTHVVMTPHCALISPGKETCRDLLPASNKRFHLRPQPGHNSAVEEKHAPFGGSACPF